MMAEVLRSRKGGRRIGERGSMRYQARGIRRLQKKIQAVYAAKEDDAKQPGVQRRQMDSLGAAYTGKSSGVQTHPKKNEKREEGSEGELWEITRNKQEALDRPKIHALRISWDAGGKKKKGRLGRYVMTTGEKGDDLIPKPSRISTKKRPT